MPNGGVKQGAGLVTGSSPTTSGEPGFGPGLVQRARDDVTFASGVPVDRLQFRASSLTWEKH